MRLRGAHPTWHGPRDLFRIYPTATSGQKSVKFTFVDHLVTTVTTSSVGLRILVKSSHCSLTSTKDSKDFFGVLLAAQTRARSPPFFSPERNPKIPLLLPIAASGPLDCIIVLALGSSHGLLGVALFQCTDNTAGLPAFKCADWIPRCEIPFGIRVRLSRARRANVTRSPLVVLGRMIPANWYRHNAAD